MRLPWVYRVEDEAGNVGEFIRYVLVYDNEGPKLVFDASTIIYYRGEEWHIDSIKWIVSDNCFPANKLKVVVASNNVDPSEIGLYQIEFLVTDPCENPASYVVNVAVVDYPSIDIEEIAVGRVNIFPNPTKGILTVKLDVIINRNIQLHLLNLHGQLLTEFRLKDMGKNDVQLDLGNYENGIYFLQFSTDQSTITKKIILNK